MVIQSDVKDADLLRAFRDGDSVAFNIFYERHAVDVYNHVLRLTWGNRADADDLTQKAWMQFIEMCLAPELDANISVKYLMTMVGSRFLDEQRKKIRHAEESVTEHQHGNQMSSERQIASWEAEQNLLQDDIQDVVSRLLSEEQRQADQTVAAARSASKRRLAQRRHEKARQRATELRTLYCLWMEGHTQQELSEILELTRDQVRERQKRIRELLTPLLEELGS